MTALSHANPPASCIKHCLLHKKISRHQTDPASWQHPSKTSPCFLPPSSKSPSTSPNPPISPAEAISASCLEFSGVHFHGLQEAKYTWHWFDSRHSPGILFLWAMLGEHSQQQNQQLSPTECCLWVRDRLKCCTCVNLTPTAIYVLDLER